jgi:hypothetical protein
MIGDGCKYTGFLSTAIVATALGLSGCESIARRDLTVQGVRPVFSGDGIEWIDAVSLILGKDGVEDANRQCRHVPRKTSADRLAPDDSDYDRFETCRVDYALATKRKYLQQDITNSKHIYERNSIQERVVWASNQRCGEFKRQLKELQAETSLTLGILATALGGAGAIFTSPGTSRALSGGAGVTSGANAETQSALFNKLAVHVIAQGIDARRDQLYKEIRKRQGETLVAYPLEAAIADAVNYHAACGSIEGLIQAGEAVSKYQDQDVGLKKLFEMIKPGANGQIVLTGSSFEVAREFPDIAETELPMSVLQLQRQRLSNLTARVAKLVDHSRKTQGQAAYNTANTALEVVQNEDKFKSFFADYLTARRALSSASTAADKASAIEGVKVMKLTATDFAKRMATIVDKAANDIEGLVAEEEKINAVKKAQLETEEKAKEAKASANEAAKEAKKATESASAAQREAAAAKLEAELAKREADMAKREADRAWGASSAPIPSPTPVPSRN